MFYDIVQHKTFKLCTISAICNAHLQVTEIKIGGTMNIKELFDQTEDGRLSFEEFESAMKNSGSKLVDLSEGKYVSVNKYNNDLQSRDSQIETLNNTLSERDNDLANLKEKLESAGVDSTKIATLTNDLTALQNKYDADTKQYREQLDHQAYEFAVKEFANNKKFSSQAAKRDFTQSMIAKALEYKDGEILGADDFLSEYEENNTDAFISEIEFEDEDEYESPLPQFVAPTQGGTPEPDAGNAFADAFHFTGVRTIPKE